jgi:O-methyltransferase domain/Dimerisation domain
VQQVNIADPRRILDIAYGFWQSKVLFAAVELDLFTKLAQGPMDLATLISRLGIHERSARDFLDALVALRLLDRTPDNHYSNCSDAAAYLVTGTSRYIGDLIKHLNARHYQNWNLLMRALLTGEPQSTLGTGSYAAFYADNCAQNIFLRGMTAGSLLAARALARVFPWNKYQTVIDIGTAQGCVPVEIAHAHQHLRGGGFDLPALADAFLRYVGHHCLTDRLKFYAGDFFNDPFPDADVLIMGRILHNWQTSVRRMLLDRAYQSILPGGALIVYDPMIDNERRHQPHGLLSSLNMLIETEGGAEYTAPECKEWMSQAGFTDINIEPLGDVHTALIGFKAPH